MLDLVIDWQLCVSKYMAICANIYMAKFMSVDKLNYTVYIEVIEWQLHGMS